MNCNTFPAHCASVVLSGLCLLSWPLCGEAQPNHPWTVQEIFAHEGELTGDPPQNISWSPDGRRATWLDDNGNIMQLDPADPRPRKLIPYNKISRLLNATISERDRDHRSRYDEPYYIWAPDSRHLLFDTNGELWLYDVDNLSGVRIGDTGMQSGDDPKFSPDGHYLSWLHDHNLYVQKPEPSASPLALTADHDPALLNGEVDWVYLEELDVRSNYFWSPDSKQIAYLQMDETHVPQYPLVDWMPEHPVIDEQRYPQPGDPNPAVRVGIVSVGGGATRWLTIPLSAGNDYIPRFGWVNSQVVWVETLSRNQQHLDLWFADVRTGEVRRVLAQTEAKYFNTTYDIKFIGDHQFLILSWRDGHTHIYRYAFDAANPPGSTANFVNEVETGDYEVMAIRGYDKKSQTLWYLSNQSNPREQQIWAVQLDGSGRHQVSRSPGVHKPDFPEQGGSYIDTSSSLLSPPVVSVCSPAGDCSTFWRSRPIQGHRIVDPHLLELTAADRVTRLYGTLLLPPGDPAARSVPLIVNPYGGPGVGASRDEWGGKRFLFDQLLAEHGFAVLHVDNRGMAGRGRDFEQVCWHNFGPPQFADQMASVDRILRDFPEVDPHRLGWWGWSWGGSFTLFALSHSDSFLAGVSVAPVTDWRNYDSIYTERYMGLPAEDAQNYRDDSDVTRAADLHGRVLILHGTGDDNVHIGNDVQYIQKLIEAGIPYGYNIYPRKTHSIAGADDRTELFSAILAHFERYLMRAPSAEKNLASRDRASR